MKQFGFVVAGVLLFLFGSAILLSLQLLGWYGPEWVWIDTLDGKGNKIISPLIIGPILIAGGGTISGGLECLRKAFM